MEAQPFRVLRCPADEARTPPEFVAVAGLLFDVSGVLYDDTFWRRWLFQLVCHMGLHTNFQAFFRLWEHDYLGPLSAADHWESLRSYLSAAGMSRGQIDEVMAAGMARQRRAEEEIRPLPGVTATLAKLSARRMPLAAVSTGPDTADEVSQRLARLGLSGRFDSVLSGVDWSAGDSETACFEAALDSLHLTPERVAYVGHSTVQLRRAAELGLHTIAFNYDDDATADVYLDQFDQLLNVVRCDQPVALAG